MRYVKFDTFAFFGVLAVLIACAAALFGCNMPTEGYPCSTDGCGSSSSSGDFYETITPLPTTADPSMSSTTAEPPDVTTGASAGPGTGMGSESSGEEVSGETSSEGTSTSSGGSESGSDSTTGVWEGFDAHHCDAECEPQLKQYDPKANACWCTTYCSYDTDCDAPEECVAGRCGIPCVDAGSCPYNTNPTMVCMMMPINAAFVCGWWGEAP